MEIVVYPGCVVGRVLPGAVVAVAEVEKAWSAVGHCYFWAWDFCLVGALILYINGEMGGGGLAPST